jgi:hypothetical protein
MNIEHIFLREELKEKELKEKRLSHLQRHYAGVPNAPV